MSETETDIGTEEQAEVAQDNGEEDTISRLADRGEETVRRLAELPGGQRALKAFNDLRLRVDELNRKVRGIDALEERITALEDRVDALDGGPSEEAEESST